MFFKAYKPKIKLAYGFICSLAAVGILLINLQLAVTRSYNAVAEEAKEVRLDIAFRRISVCKTVLLY